MKSARMESMVKGWFVGGFSPAALTTTACEVAVKTYRAGDNEGSHYHKEAIEVTVVLSGTVKMVGREWNSGDIVIVEPLEATDFLAISDAITVVVKVPGALNDKYTLPPDAV